MRFLFPLILFIFFSVPGCTKAGENRPDNPKALGEEVFKSFQHKSYATFEKYLFTEADCEIMAKNIDAPEKLKPEIAQRMKAVVAVVRNHAKENFEQIIAAGEEQGVQWDKVELTAVEYELQTRDNIESTDIFLTCRYDTLIFAIKLDNCHKSEDWLMMDKAEIRFRE